MNVSLNTHKFFDIVSFRRIQRWISEGRGIDRHPPSLFGRWRGTEQVSHFRLGSVRRATRTLLKKNCFLSSIALPFKKDNLQSLYTEQSAFVLVKYYVASVKCIVLKSQTKAELQVFNREFFVWLQQSVRCESLWSKVAIFIRLLIFKRHYLRLLKGTHHRILSVWKSFDRCDYFLSSCSSFNQILIEYFTNRAK